MFACRYDPKANHELPLTPAGLGAIASGSGPRHLLFSADGKHAWLTTEMSAQVAVFTITTTVRSHRPSCWTMRRGNRCRTKPARRCTRQAMASSST